MGGFAVTGERTLKFRDYSTQYETTLVYDLPVSRQDLFSNHLALGSQINERYFW
jgi:hypothetical protein